MSQLCFIVKQGRVVVWAEDTAARRLCRSLERTHSMLNMQDMTVIFAKPSYRCSTSVRRELMIVLCSMRNPVLLAASTHLCILVHSNMAGIKCCCFL